MTVVDINPSELRVFFNHIYEYQKGVRKMVLYTSLRMHVPFITNRLKKLNIAYVIQPVDNKRVNIYFGNDECIEVIRKMVTRPLNLLSPEEDFILGALLGYDISVQCKRYCSRKSVPEKGAESQFEAVSAEN